MNPSTLPRHLTDDIQVELARRDQVYPPFRLRIWRGDHQASVILASWLDAQGRLSPIPPWALTRLANYAQSALLGWPFVGFMFFELGHDRDDHPVITQAIFEYFGNCNQRLRAYNPSKFETSVTFFTAMLGGGDIDWNG